MVALHERRAKKKNEGRKKGALKIALKKKKGALKKKRRLKGGKKSKKEGGKMKIGSPEWFADFAEKEAWLRSCQDAIEGAKEEDLLKI